MYTYTYIHRYLFMYTEREREGEGGRGKERERASDSVWPEGTGAATEDARKGSYFAVRLSALRNLEFRVYGLCLELRV